MDYFIKKAEYIEDLIRNELRLNLVQFLYSQGQFYGEHNIEKTIYSYIPGSTEVKRANFLGKKDLHNYLTSVGKTKKIFQKALKRFLLTAINSLLIFCCSKVNKSILFKILADKTTITKMVQIIHTNLDSGILKLNSIEGDRKDTYFFQELIMSKIKNQANIIREWWVNIYYSPYTKIGKKRLEKSYDDLFKDN
jgi:hypothetical protein